MAGVSSRWGRQPDSQVRKTRLKSGGPLSKQTGESESRARLRTSRPGLHRANVFST